MAEIETDTDSAMEKPASRSWRVWMILSLATALTSSIVIFNHNFWWDLFGGTFWLIDLGRTMLQLLWMLTTFVAFLRFPGARKKIWWLLLPAPLVFLPILQYLFVMFAWGTRGFAP